MNIKSLENVEITEKKVKGVIQKVTYTLNGMQSAWATKLAKRYDEIDKTIDELETEREKMNAEIKKYADDMFEQEDKTVTRVIETCSLVITVGKKETATYTDFDKDAFIKAVYNLLPELKDSLDKLKETYTTTRTVEKSPKLSIKTKQIEESVDENISFIEKIKNYMKNVVKQISKKLDVFDMKYDMLLAKYDL